MKLYLVSGLGADEKVFRNLTINPHEIHPIPWKTLQPQESFRHYCERLASEIDTSSEFALGGLSLGGICAQEMTRFVNPRKLVLISTIKSREEMPPLYRVAGAAHLENLLPEAFFKWVAYHSAPAIGASDDEEVFKSMLGHTEQQFFKWAISAVAGWQGVEHEVPTLHLHGNSDLVFPSRFIQNYELMEGGTHYMVVNKATEISEKIKRFLGS